VIFNYNTILIDTFDQNLVGAEIIADYTVPANGTYHIQVDYRELSNSAFANVSLASLSGGVISPTTTPALTTTAALPPTDVTAVVTAGRLNVRNAPQTGTILTTVNRNQSFPVVATNSDSSWYLLNVGDTQGWVSATFVTLNPADATVPIAGSGDVTTTPVPSTGELTATADPFTVNIRSGPSVEDERLGRLVSGQSAPIIGRTADNQWWQIEANGVTGWVSAQFAVITQGADVNSIPVTDTGTPAAEATDSP
jgi:uncharacterized protein YraI